MNSNDIPPQFQFDVPPPFSYEVFKTQFFGKMLDLMGGPGGDHLKGLEGNEREFLVRLFYLVTVVKIQNPAVSQSELLYALNFGMIRHFLDQGQPPEAAREELAKVPWDVLPGMDEYDRETANDIAMRAFGDALAGRPQSPRY